MFYGRRRTSKIFNLRRTLSFARGAGAARAKRWSIMYLCNARPVARYAKCLVLLAWQYQTFLGLPDVDWPAACSQNQVLTAYARCARCLVPPGSTWSEKGEATKEARGAKQDVVLVHGHMSLVNCHAYIIGHNYHGLYCHGHKFSRT